MLSALVEDLRETPTVRHSQSGNVMRRTNPLVKNAETLCLMMI